MYTHDHPPRCFVIPTVPHYGIVVAALEPKAKGWQPGSHVVAALQRGYYSAQSALPPFFPFLLGTIRETLRRRIQSEPARLPRPGSTQLN